MEYLYDGVQNTDDTYSSANFSEFQGFSILSPKLKKEPKYEAVKGNFEEYSVSLDQSIVEPVALPPDIDAPSFGPEIEALEQMQNAIQNRQLKEHEKPTVAVEFNEYFITKQSEEDKRLQQGILT
jgi:hypothetical protein